MSAVSDKAICVGCQTCVGVCPVSAIHMEGDKSVIDPEACVDCGACVAACPVKAISLR